MTHLRYYAGLRHSDGGRGGVGAGQATLGQAGEVVEVAAASGEVKKCSVLCQMPIWVVWSHMSHKVLIVDTSE